METQKRLNERAKGIPEEGGVESMISNFMKVQFESVLKQQHLADVESSFSEPDFFDEIPLYSRYSQIAFLKPCCDTNLSLIVLAVDYLQRVISDVHIRSTRFVAITVISGSDDDYIVPSIFVCNGKVKTRLKELHLSRPSTEFGKRIGILVERARLQMPGSVLEDTCTVPDEVRVFIGYKLPPRGIMNLESFVGTQRHQPIQRL